MPNNVRIGLGNMKALDTIVDNKKRDNISTNVPQAYIKDKQMSVVHSLDIDYDIRKYFPYGVTSHRR